MVLTREQTLAVLYQYARLQGYNISKTAELNAYSDRAELSDYAVNPMQWAVANNLLEGFISDKFEPKKPMKRGELAIVVMNFMKAFSK